MTSRSPLPDTDATIDELPVAARAALADMWFGRAQSELDVGARFERLAGAFADGSAPDAVCGALVQAGHDEAEHSRICAAVGARYAGGPRDLAPRRDAPLVRFGDTSEETSRLLHLVLLSCVNEVTSTFYLRECMKRCRAPLAHAALRTLLADDVQHARVGWAHLASDRVTPEDREHVARALPTLLRLSAEAWTDVPERTESWFGDHGCLGRDTARAAFEQALHEVMLPGFAFVGIDAAPAERWAAETLARAP